ncbi:hypothetical protein BVRB_6g127960 [Beta vulgaris subsp. vulgaris]|nr:hypothetical protein BVRB_6g127960 [Beta vulgaris subsp. vulgaris]
MKDLYKCWRISLLIVLWTTLLLGIMLMPHIAESARFPRRVALILRSQDCPMKGCNLVGVGPSEP